MWEEPPQVRGETALVNTDDNRYWITVEVPAPYEFHVDCAPPIIRDRRNALLRPYEKFLDDWKPVVGLVQHYLLGRNVGGVPRVLFSLAVREHPNSLHDPSVLPASVYLFPGFGQSGMTHRSGVRIQPHHITVREGEVGEEREGRKVVVYTHGLNLDIEGKPRERFETEVAIVEELPSPSVIHLASTRIDGPRDLDPAGFAYTHVAPKLVDIRRKQGSFLPNPTVRNHWLDPLEIDRRVQGGSHHLWAMMFLSNALLSEKELDRMIRFFLGVEAERGAPEVAERHLEEGDIWFRAHGVDLQQVGVAAEYRYLLTLRAVIPGAVDPNTTLAALAHPVPVSDAEWGQEDG